MWLLFLHVVVQSYVAIHVSGITDSELLYLAEIQIAFCDLEYECVNFTTGAITEVKNTASPLSQGTRIAPAERLPVQPPDNPHKGCCGKCSCDTSECHLTDTCCLETLWHPSNISKESRMTCELPQYRPYKQHVMVNVLKPLNMIRMCREDTDSSFDISEKCAEPEKHDEIFTKIPVTDVTTTYTYQNHYCAYCNDVNGSNLVYWDVTLKCLRGTFQPQDAKTILKEIRETESCNLVYNRPEALVGLPIYQCSLVISQCNVTGLWRKYDPLIEAACSAYSTIFNFKYRNVFCYICNTDDEIGPSFCRAMPEWSLIVDFMAILKFEPDIARNYDASMDVCSENQIHDPILVGFVSTPVSLVLEVMHLL